MLSQTKWQCIAWEGKTSHYNPKTNCVLANHRRHAEMNLLRNLQLKGSYEKKYLDNCY